MENKDKIVKPVAIITGASSGIGEKAALTLARNEFRVVIAARRQNRLDEIAEQIRKMDGEVIPVQLDLSQVDQIRNLVETTLNVFGQIDVLVNNAGSARHLWLDEQSLEEDIHNQLQVNLVGMIQLTRLVVSEMITVGSGQVIHISSIASWVGIPTYSIYNASKFGSRGFLASLRRELRGTGVTISEIFPGAVDTEFGQGPDVNWKTTTVTPKFALLSAQTVADQILKTIRRKKTRSVIPGFMWFAIWGDAHFPGLFNWILSKFFYSSDGIRYTWRQRKE